MEPDRVFEFEPAEARELQWLPLAVRYKLDGCGRKIGLKEWQGLALERREALVRCPAGALFERELISTIPSARRLETAGRQPPAVFDEYLATRTTAAQGQGCI